MVKKSLNYGWDNLKTNVVNNRVQTVGILADAQSKDYHDDLLNQILTHGIKVENCSFLVFNSEKRNEFTDKYSHFGSKDFGWSGAINEKFITDFCNTDFDLLVNFFDEANPFLMKVAQQSKAGFKVGFDTIDERLNHFLLQTPDTKPKVFVDELFKYLKILNKI
ncbi:DUF6913 domain-containing protein [Flavobacterium turcicum]|uniref:DUF6913 domain-containing protein n=1 Tax=Flavobacterium turcicum TaxID=2764718 RepID=UPI00164D7891|nr:hypothetical protein [Flavobacterium turcicum]